MSNTVSRIKQYIDYKGLSVRKFEETTGFSNGAFASQFKNKKTIGVDKVENILQVYDDINPIWLLTGEGEMLKKSIGSDKELNTISNVVNVPKVVTVDSTNKDNIVLVPVHAQAGYLNGYDKPEYIKKLPTYNLPNLRNGIYRMFEVKGHSMLPTLHQGSFIVGQFVENWVTDIKDDRIYIIVSKEEGVIVKRCLNRIEKYNSIFCKSDNRAEFPSYPIHPDDVKEVWEVKIALIANLPNPADLFDRMNDLEADLFNKINGLESEINHLKEENKRLQKN